MRKINHAYLVGGGIGSLAAAAFMIRDGGVAGSSITIFDAGPLCGGSLDAAGDPERGYSMRGGRMLTADNYECTWDLFRSIPSLGRGGQSVFEETMIFNEANVSHAQARLVDRRGARTPVESMGFTVHDRVQLLELAHAEEASLGASRITDHLSAAFFNTPFWLMWSTTFAFQPWHSAVEFRRYLHRFMLEFPRIDTLGGVKRTIFNQYDSLVLPLLGWLRGNGVRIINECRVTRCDLARVGELLQVSRLHCTTPSGQSIIEPGDKDLVFLQNGSMTDASSVGSMAAPPLRQDAAAAVSWSIWEDLAAHHAGFGRPAAFNSNVTQSTWSSFTVTLRTRHFFDQMQAFSGNVAGTGGLVTFQDSNWLMSIVLPHQPHFIGQPEDVQVFWGYGLFTDRVGNFVPRSMEDCSGADLLDELRGHLRFAPDSTAGAICIPCRMPFITSMFMPRLPGDRPLPVPAGTSNLGLVSQFVEIAGETVFTVEFSVRAAQIAVYQLLGVLREVPLITPHDAALRTRFDVLLKSLA